MRLFRRLLWLAAFVGLLVVGWRFAARNATAVSVNYLFGEFTNVSVWVVVVVAFAAGAALAGLVGAYQAARLSLLTRRYRKSADELEAEVHRLRNLPLASGEAAAGSDAAPLPRDPLPAAALERGP